MLDHVQAAHDGENGSDFGTNGKEFLLCLREGWRQVHHGTDFVLVKGTNTDCCVRDFLGESCCCVTWTGTSLSNGETGTDVLRSDCSLW